MTFMRVGVTMLVMFALALGVPTTARAEFRFVTAWGSARGGRRTVLGTAWGSRARGTGSVYRRRRGRKPRPALQSRWRVRRRIRVTRRRRGSVRGGRAMSPRTRSARSTSPIQETRAFSDSRPTAPSCWHGVRPAPGNGQFLSPSRSRDRLTRQRLRRRLADQSRPALYVRRRVRSRLGHRRRRPGQFSSRRRMSPSTSSATSTSSTARRTACRSSPAKARCCSGGEAAGRATGSSTRPAGIATDGAGNVYVADTGNQRIQVFNSDGAFLERFGGPGSGPGQFALAGRCRLGRERGRLRRRSGQRAGAEVRRAGAAAAAADRRQDRERRAAVRGRCWSGAPAPARSCALARGQQIPIGSLVDATRGVVRLTTASNLRGGQQTARFYDGRFRLRQRRTQLPVTELDLAGGDFGVCRRSRAQGAVVRAASDQAAQALQAPRAAAVGRRQGPLSRGRALRLGRRVAARSG